MPRLVGDESDLNSYDVAQEIAHLHRRIDGLARKSPAVNTAKAQAENLVPFLFVIAQKVGGDPSFDTTGFEFGDGFTVQKNGQNGFATIAYVLPAVAQQLMIGQPVVDGATNNLLFVGPSGQLAQDADLQRAAPAADRLSDGITIGAVPGMPTNKGLICGVLTNDNATEYSGLEVIRVCNGSIPGGNNLFSSGISFGIGQNGTYSQPHIGAITVRRDGAMNTGKMVFIVTKNGVVGTLMFLDADGNLQTSPLAGAYGFRLANVTSASVTAPAAGALIHDTGSVKHYTGSTWETLSLGGLPDRQVVSIGPSGGGAYALANHDTALVDCSTQNWTVTLPTAAAGAWVEIRRLDTNGSKTLTISANTGDTTEITSLGVSASTVLVAKDGTSFYEVAKR
jgi:hypothetical protein